MKLRIYLLTLLLGVLGFAGCEAAEQNMRETALPASTEAPAEKTIAESHGKVAKEETVETPLLPIDASPLAMMILYCMVWPWEIAWILWSGIWAWRMPSRVVV